VENYLFHSCSFPLKNQKRGGENTGACGEIKAEKPSEKKGRAKKARGDSGPLNKDELPADQRKQTGGLSLRVASRRRRKKKVRRENETAPQSVYQRKKHNR